MTDADSLQAAELALQQAQVRSDVETMDRLLHDDEIHVAFDGAITGKQFDLDNHRAGLVRIDSLETEDLQIQVTEGVGITILTCVLTGSLEKRSFISRLRFVRTWCHGPQGWRVVASSMTLLGPPVL